MDDYLLPTVSDEDVFKIIFDKITTQTPFTLTRFGDGEISFLNNVVSDDLKIRVCKLWNYDYQKEYNKVNNTVLSILNNALKHSDIIGLLDFNNPICSKRKFDKNKWMIKKDYINNIRQTDIMVCDHQITRNELFGDIKSFKKILQGRKVNIVSPNIKELKNNKIDELLEVEVNYTVVDNDRFALLDRLKLIKEDVVLYGASLLGKDTGIVLKSYGKISIDFGATLDAWGGIVSRPWFREGSYQEHCVIK